MLAEMQSQTEAALGNIVSDFQGAFDNVAMSVPVGGGTAAATAPTPVSVPSIFRTELTIPITVTLDGKPIAKIVKRIFAEERSMRERFGAQLI
jgi:hypothetical protein